jgi:voltage-gated potassium channel
MNRKSARPQKPTSASTFNHKQNASEPSAQTGKNDANSHFAASLRELYESHTQRAVRFRYGLLAFDFATVAFIVLSSFTPRTIVTEALDVVFGLIILADFISRLIISRSRLRYLMNPVTWADAIAIVSFLAPFTSEAAAFLRVLRTLRLLHTYQLLARLRRDVRFFRRHEEVILAVSHLAIFIFIMTGIVYETQHRRNPEIGNYVDALYFTVSSLTTTGYGDVVLSGTLGRLVSVVIMIFGVTLFFRLARAILQPSKVRFPCPSCGLQRHDQDAVHCKACGVVLNIPDEGDD